MCEDGLGRDAQNTITKRNFYFPPDLVTIGFSVSTFCEKTHKHISWDIVVLLNAMARIIGLRSFCGQTATPHRILIG